MAKVRARPGSAARRVVLAGATVAAVAGLAACGTVPAGKAGSAGTASAAPRRSASAGSPLQGSVPVGAGPALCAGISHLTSLTVIRVVTLPNHLHFPFPAKVTLSSPAHAQAVAAAACRLPELPRVMVTCPADLGVFYRLVFAAPGQDYPVVTASATGCSKLTGLDITRQAIPGFWATLGRAMGLATPGMAAFGGNPG